MPPARAPPNLKPVPRRGTPPRISVTGPITRPPPIRLRAVLAASAFAFCAAALLPTAAPAFNLPEMPQPANPSKEEQAFMRKLDAAIKPLVDYDIRKGDIDALKAAIGALAKGDAGEANTLKSQISDATARKLVDWFRLRNGLGTAAEYRDFLAANPAWASPNLLTEKRDEVLFTQGGNSADIKSHFANGAPTSGAGYAALASAHLAEGNKDEARRLAVHAWRNHDFSKSLEKGFLERFGSMLTRADHKWRLDRLLISDARWKSQKQAVVDQARRVLPHLPEAERKKAEARIGVLFDTKKSRSVVATLPAEEVPDWGLVFHRIQALRRSGKVEKAASLMLSAPTEEALTVVPDVWWTERRTSAYAALRIGKPKLAYELVREAGPLSVNPLKDQAFMAGWIAQQYLNDPKTAEPHFQTFYKAADGPLSRAKARYWMGRNAAARGDDAAARRYYQEATADPDTFHALLARQKLEPGTLAITIAPPQVPSDAEARAFFNLDAARAVIIAHKAGLDSSISRLFLLSLRQHLKTEPEAAMTAHLAEAIGDTQSAVRTAKTAIARGQNLYYYAYPVHPFPAYKPLRKPPETAFLLGLARQETEFNTQIVSGAGAKGILQVMSITAKHVCRDYKIKCDLGRLLKDPAYNTMLASAYVGDRMRDVRGSYILTLTSYNAGPGRTRQWLREFGDPRDPGVDPIDWIERIPIEETREYVGKVLSNIQIYRARLGEGERAVRLQEDLHRASVAGRATESSGG